MKSDRNNFMPQSMPFPGMGNMPMNMMMFPNYMNDSCSNVENRVSALEKKIKVLENRISRIENPYQNTNIQNFQDTNANMNNQQMNMPYQTTQNNAGYNGEMYMV